MKRTTRSIIIGAAFFLAAGWAFGPVYGDHHGKKETKRYQERNREHHEQESQDGLTPVSNAFYQNDCGACHFAYQPELLPSGSWVKILAGLGDHFGEAIELDPDSRRAITEYLKSNGAEYSIAKRAVKLMRSLDGQTPLRITEIPYIIEKHHEVSKSILERENIGSLSNCSACHTTAERGIYDDDSVVIPK